MKHFIAILFLSSISSSVWSDQQGLSSDQKLLKRVPDATRKDMRQLQRLDKKDEKKALLTPKPQMAKKVLPFPEPQMERNYNWLTNNLRCQKCANQTLADSQVDLAADLRDRVYQQVLTGKTKEEIVKFLMKRFGDRVSYDPPFRAVTALLWTSPFLLLLYGLFVMKRAIRNRHKLATNNTRTLSDDEQKRLDQLLSDESTDSNNGPKT